MTDRSNDHNGRRRKPRIRWTLGRKIGGLAGLLLVLLMAVAAYSLVQLRGVGQEIELITGGDLVVGRAVSDISRRVSERLTVSSVAQMAGLGESGVMNKEKMGEEVQRALDKSARESAAIQSGIAHVRAEITVRPDRTKPEPRYARLFDLLSKVERENGAYETGIHNVFGMLTDLNFAQVNVAIIGVENNEERLSLAILELSGEIRERTEESATQAQKRQRDAARTIAGTSALALIVGIVLSLLLVRRLTMSVVTVSERTKQISDTIGEDHFSHEEIAVRSTDEIGDLAAVFNQMSETLERNISERKRFQDELAAARDMAVEANRTKSDFLANMSHELRTPLNAIIGYSEMLQEEAEDLGQNDLVPDLSRINGAGKHLLELINDVLDLSKIEAGRMELYLETFEVSNMVEEAVALIQPLIQKGDNKLEVQCPDDIGAMRADMTKVRQALFNLLSNASKFTKDGTIILRVARDKVDGEQWLRFSPNPPKDTDGRREESGRGGEGATGEIAWVPFGVGRSADGLHRRTGAPMAVCGSCDAGDGERIRSRELSRTGLARVCGDLRLSGGWVADGAVRPGVEWLAAGPRRG